MAIIKFNADYETITKDKEYKILTKSYTDDSYEYLIFLDDINEEIVLKREFNAPVNEMFTVIV